MLMASACALTHASALVFYPAMSMHRCCKGRYDFVVKAVVVANLDVDASVSIPVHVENVTN